MGESKKSLRQCTRRLEVDAAHRVMRHESKCRHLHGHRYVIEVTAGAEALDDLGRVVDFGVIKSVFGSWLDEKWDHGTIVNEFDVSLIRLCKEEGWKYYTLKGNPTAENMAKYLHGVAGRLMKPYGVVVMKIRVYELSLIHI